MRSRGAMREQLAALCTNLNAKIDQLDVRVYYKWGARPPLPDFPVLHEGFALSDRAVQLAPAGTWDMFRLLPLRITGGGREKRSGTWYEAPEEEWREIEGIDHRYFMLMATSTFMPGKEVALPPDLSPSPEGEGIAAVEAMLQWAAREAAAQRSEPNNIAAYFARRSMPMIFSFGGGRIYFTDTFVKWAKKNKLTGGITADVVVEFP